MAHTGVVDKDCLYSVVQNVSGVVKRFGFLPPHGVKLQPQEEYTVWGSILEAVNLLGDRNASKRNHQALAAALDRGDIVIMSTPSPVMVDVGTQQSQILRLRNGTLGAHNPCWLSQTSDTKEVNVPDSRTVYVK